MGCGGTAAEEEAAPPEPPDQALLFFFYFYFLFRCFLFFFFNFSIFVIFYFGTRALVFVGLCVDGEGIEMLMSGRTCRPLPCRRPPAPPATGDAVEAAALRLVAPAATPEAHLGAVDAASVVVAQAAPAEAAAHGAVPNKKRGPSCSSWADSEGKVFVKRLVA